MIFVDKKYTINITERIDEFDRTILLNLYQPIIGSSATGLYLTLIQEFELLQKINSMPFTIERLFNLTSTTEKQFERNLKKLEALKLVKTLIAKTTGNCKFNILAPLSPKDFFANEVFNKTLNKKLGEENYEAAKFIFKERSSKRNDEEFEEVSVDFADIFEDEFNTIANTIANTTLFTSPISKSKNVKLCKKLLNLDKVAELIYQENIVMDFEDEYISNLLSTALAIRSFNETEIAEMIIASYSFENREINEKIFEIEVLKALKASKNLRNITLGLSSAEIKKAEEMSFYDCETYYEMLTNSLPNSIIKNGIRDIISKYKSTRGVVNCLMEFSFLKNEGKVIVNYISKIAETLYQENLNTAHQVMAFLKGANKGAKRTKKSEIVVKSTSFQSSKVTDMEFETFDFKQYENDELTDNDILVIANNM
ncbi:hypothetical protein CXP39_00945 [Mesoplasma syrphidae]|uniref:Uncharacterized protein n=1 Tax=Mesoplasma syrphidae TaxID=225999 RepID=A0A2K9BQU0_9MOLU|nr:DnaD domain protein [Mesoplasma syrphidae]AUF83372.1 hypothetical protein CXP39_00945 [Mesoplasma syrphidae]